MGNALVVPIVTKMGARLLELLENDDPPDCGTA